MSRRSRKPRRAVRSPPPRRPNSTVAERLLAEAAASHRDGDLEAAVEKYTRATRLMPHYAQLHHNLGLALLALGRLVEAAGRFRHALTLKPDFVQSHQSLGEALAGLGEWSAALQAYGEALALEPGSTSTLISQGVAFREMGRPDDALATFRHAVALDPTSVALHNQIGLTLYDQGDGVGAVHWFAQASELDPTDDSAATALGRALLSLDRPVEAEVPLRRATVLLPESPEAFFSLGVSLKKQGRWHEAVTPFSRTLQLDPDHHEARRWRAGARLVTGDFEGGFEDFLRVLRNVDGLTRPLPGPTWDGSSLSGKTLLLYAEQGFGDAVLFARFLPQTKELGGTVLLEVPQTLARLFEGAEGVDRLLVTGEELPHFDTHAPLTHVAALLGVTVDTIPATVAYLSAGADVVACRTLPARAVPSELRVGIVWAGSPTHANDGNRSMALDDLAPLLTMPGLRVFSLQVGPGRDQLATHPAASRVLDLGGKFADFADTARAIADLDLVISVDTAVAHLTGAMGKPLALLLPFLPEWYWLLEREDSPWYPTARLFRQTTAKDWTGVIDRLVRTLACVVERRQARDSHPFEGTMDTFWPPQDPNYRPHAYQADLEVGE